MLFENEQSAAAYVEAPDVGAGIYRGYDEEGRLMAISTEGLNTWIEPAEHIPTHDGALRKAVIDNLRHLRNPRAASLLCDAGVDPSRLNELPTGDLLDIVTALNSALSQSPLKALLRRVASAIRCRGN